MQPIVRPEPCLIVMVLLHFRSSCLHTGRKEISGDFCVAWLGCQQMSPTGIWWYLTSRMVVVAFTSPGFEI